MNRLITTADPRSAPVNRDVRTRRQSPQCAPGIRSTGALCLAVFLFVLNLARGAETTPFLGPIPVQFVDGTRELTLDFHRFYEPAEKGEAVKIESARACTASFDADSLKLRVQIPETVSGIVDLPFSIAEKIHSVLTIAVRPAAGHTFTFKPATRVSTVFLAGSFNDWSKDKTPLLSDPQTGIYSITLPLKPGSYSYKFVVDGKWTPDPENKQRADDGMGGFNSTLEIAASATGNKSGPQIFASRLEAGVLTCGVIANSAPIAGVSTVLELPDGSARALEFQEEMDAIRVPIGDAPADAWVRVVASDRAGAISNVLRFPLDAGKSFHWQDAVMYFPMTDRFFDGDTTNNKPVDDPKVKPPANFHGGDWAGITQKIESGYFDNLGVNTLWLGPLNRNPAVAWQEAIEPRRWYTGYHGYWPVSPTEVDPHWGSAKDLKKLITAAHGHGMKVLADMVLHHVHTDHPWWKEHRDWFGSLELPDGTKNLRIWEAQQYTTWFDSFLPTFNWNNQEAVSALIDNAAWWAKEYNFDGFRLDAVKHIPLDFWWKFRRALRAQVERPAGRRLYLVGESFLDPAGINAYVGPNMLDGQFNFPLYDTIQSAFGTGKGALAELDSALSATEQVYGKEALMSPLIGNHDKGRFLAYADGDLPDPHLEKEEEVGWQKPPKVDRPESYKKLELAQTLLLTIDGVPMIYYGDEFGMTGAGDPDNRRDMRFGDAILKSEAAVLENFARLGKIRHDHPALRYGSRRVLQVDGDGYAFIRRHLDDSVVCVFNRGATAMNVAFKVAAEMANGTFQNLLDGSKVEIADGVLKMEVPPRSAAVIGR